MNDEIEPILIGEVEDIDVGSVENFEYDDVNYAISVSYTHLTLPTIYSV